MAKKVILKDDNVEIMPITRGELVLDSSGQLAFHSSQFLATQSLPGLMSAADKTKLDAIKSTTIDSALSTTSDNAVKNKVVTAAINEAKTLANNAQDAADNALDTANSAQGIANAIKSSYLKSASVSGNLLTLTDLDDEETKFNNTTYTFDSGSNGSFTVTPTGGEALTITVGGVLTDDKVKQTNTTSSGSYRLLFSYTADNTTRTEGARKSSKLLFNPSTGALTATSFSGKLAWTNLTEIPESFTPSTHNHSTNQISALTDYSKATSISDLATTDTLNIALGKLEYKADTAYNIIKEAYDGDGTIENLNEILKVLEGIKDTETILAIIGKYLPLTGGTLSNTLYIKSKSAVPLRIYRNTNPTINFILSGGENGDVNFGYLGFTEQNKAVIMYGSNDGSTRHELIHAGNYTSYTPILNSSSTHATNSSVIYAPTTAGTSGLFLVSNGSGAPTWSFAPVVSSSANGLAPKVISTNTDLVGSGYYVLASTDGSAAPSWYKLPGGAFKTGTVTSITVTGSNGLSGTGTITSSGTITLSNSGVRSVTLGTGDNVNKLAVNTGGTSTYLTIPYATTSSNGVFYIAGTGTTAGTWLGDHAGIGSYYTGLTIAYKVPVAGASTTTLNINNLGAKTCYMNTSKLTTHYGVGAVVILVYDGTYFRVADYDTNSNTQIRIYRQNSGYNADYPLIASRTAASSIGTAGSNSSYTSVYGVMWDDTTKIPTLNPSTGEIKAVKFTGILNGTANKVANSLVLKIKSGSTEGTSLYTYDGSAGKTLDIVAGTNVTLTASAGKLTIASSHVTYTLSGVLNGNTFVSTLKPSSGSNSTSTVPAMSAATASAAGKAGLVPAPSAGSLNSFLRGDGTWVNVDAGTVISLPKELTVTADWMDTGIDGDDLETGTYIVLVSCAANNDALGYDCYWSGIMSWWKGRTNDTESDEILLHRTGRSYANTIYLRTIMRSNTDTNGLKLQIAANTNIGTKYTYTFKFKKVI